MDTLKMSSGVEFTVNVVSAIAFRDLQRTLEKQKPQPPVMFIEAKGREEENDSDPDYLEALELYDEMIKDKLYDASIILGIAVSSIPEGFPEFTDRAWSEPFELLGIPKIAENGSERFVAWVKYVAAPSTKDMAAIATKVFRVMGVREEDVAAVAESFPNRKERRANRTGKSVKSD